MRVSGDGRDYRALALGPIGVVPSYQRAGLGSDLIRGALGIAKATGEELVFVLGEPEYYTRYGFTARTAAPFASPYAGPFLMAVRMRDTVQLPTSGTAEYARAFAAL